jgi:hypothetical protein
MDKEYKNVHFAGDGNFIDRGRKYSIERFYVDFGKIELNKVGEYHFNFTGLPEICFSSGIVFPDYFYGQKTDLTLEVKSMDSVINCRDSDKISIDIKCGNRTIYQFSGSLKCNVRSDNSNFIWTNGSPIPNAWMAYGYNDSAFFLPRANQMYSISLFVKKPYFEHPNGKLVLSGGGWKDHVNCSDTPKKHNESNLNTNAHITTR